VKYGYSKRPLEKEGKKLEIAKKIKGHRLTAIMHGR
jgi:hypothetical protein